ncbi:MAG: hydrogenase [Candidatus Firestonebacteria bacterium]|nr:hydrogenase [Candidatus Firestonebacteria bacterium]
MTAAVCCWFLSLALAPLFLGIINRTKAFFAGRHGVPWCQVYFDLWKLLHKGVVCSRTTTWVFRLGPMLGLAAMLGAAALLPWGAIPAGVAFTGDMILFAYAFALARFGTVLAALDTGSSFEGMGASREIWISVLAEPVFFVCLGTLVAVTHQGSLSGVIPALNPQVWPKAGLSLVLLGGALFLVLLAENARIPVDDPNTHLELTMIHEVMVLDHAGPDLAFIVYGAGLKLWVLAALLVNVLVPWKPLSPWGSGAVMLAGMLGVALAVGITESVMARLRLRRIPQMLLIAGGFAALALILTLR